MRQKAHVQAHAQAEELLLQQRKVLCDIWFTHTHVIPLYRSMKTRLRILNIKYRREERCVLLMITDQRFVIVAQTFSDSSPEEAPPPMGMAI